MVKKIPRKINKVCIISDSFIPKKTSAAGMLYNLSNEFIKNNIKVICVFGSKKKDFNKINNNKVENYNLSGIRLVSNNFMSNFREGSLYSRFFYEIILSISLCYEILKNRKIFDGVDLVIWFAPSSLLWLPSLLLKKKTKAPLYLIVRDIFPDWLINIGLIKNRILIVLLKLITWPQFLIPDFIGCESIGDTELVRKKVKNKKVETFYNWPSLNYDLQTDIDLTKLNYLKFYKNNKNNNNLFGVYTGNDSVSHDLISGLDFTRLFLETTKIRKKIILNFFSSPFQLVSNQNNLIEKKWEMLPDYFLPHIYKHADFGIVSLSVNHKTNNLPGKFISYIQFGLPIICFAKSDSELANLIIDSDCGCVIDIRKEESHNRELLLNFLLNFNKNRQKYKKNSLKLFNNYFSIDVTVKNLINKYQNI